MTDREIIEQAFDEISLHIADPVVRDIAADLRRVCLEQNAALDAVRRKVGLPDNTRHSVRVGSALLPDEEGIDPDDPRSTGWYGRMCDLWDMRDKEAGR